MSRSSFRAVFIFILVVYLICLLMGVWSAFNDDWFFERYKDLVPLIAVIPAAILTYAFQQRSSTAAEARSVLSDVGTACAAGRAYLNYATRGGMPPSEIQAQLWAARSRVLTLYRMPRNRKNRKETPIELMDSLIKELMDSISTESYDDECERLRVLLASEIDVIGSWYYERDV